METLMRRERNRITQAIEELKGENPAFAKVSRSEFLLDEMESLQTEIADAHHAYEGYWDKGLPYWWREAVLKLRDVNAMEGKLKRYKSELYYLWQQGKRESLTRAMIDRALEYPIDEIVEVNHAGFALCPNHDDQSPSLYTKGNFGYCFVCGWHGDPIAIYMLLHNVPFVEAVRKLQ